MNDNLRNDVAHLLRITELMADNLQFLGRRLDQIERMRSQEQAAAPAVAAPTYIQTHIRGADFLADLLFFTCDQKGKSMTYREEIRSGTDAQLTAHYDGRAVAFEQCEMAIRHALAALDGEAEEARKP